MSFSTAVTTAVRWFDRYTLASLNVAQQARTGREPVIRALEDPSSIARRGRAVAG